MRMWMLPPEILCKKHLLGEHGEIHKHKHNFEKRHKIDKRIYPIVQIEPESMASRHDALAQEMIARGYNHQSPYSMPDISSLGNKAKVKANLDYNMADLANRCPEGAKRMMDYENKAN